jgi:hypothetical protein
MFWPDLGLGLELPHAKVGPPDALKLGGPRQPLAIALPAETAAGSRQEKLSSRSVLAYDNPLPAQWYP